MVSGVGFGSSGLETCTSEGLHGLSCQGLGFRVFDSLVGFCATPAFGDTVFPPFWYRLLPPAPLLQLSVSSPIGVISIITLTPWGFCRFLLMLLLTQTPKPYSNPKPQNPKTPKPHTLLGFRPQKTKGGFGSSQLLLLSSPHLGAEPPAPALASLELITLALQVPTL